MSGPEQAYLALVIGAMAVFMGVLGWASLKLGGERNPEETQRAAAASTKPRISEVKSRA